jgi:hypothetical protein
VKDVDKALGDRIHPIEKEQTYYRVIGAVALALVVTLTVNWLKEVVSPRLPQPISSSARSWSPSEALLCIDQIADPIASIVQGTGTFDRERCELDGAYIVVERD